MCCTTGPWCHRDSIKPRVHTVHSKSYSLKTIIYSVFLCSEPHCIVIITLLGFPKMNRCAPQGRHIAHLSESHDKLKRVLIEIRFVRQNSNFGLLLTRTVRRRSGTPPNPKTDDENLAAAKASICRRHLKKQCQGDSRVPQARVFIRHTRRVGLRKTGGR